jgi:hypothetical protein
VIDNCCFERLAINVKHAKVIVVRDFLENREAMFTNWVYFIPKQSLVDLDGLVSHSVPLKTASIIIVIIIWSLVVIWLSVVSLQFNAW